MVTGGEMSATAQATSPSTITPTDRPTNTPIPQRTDTPTAEHEPSHTPQASVPPMAGSEDKTLGGGLPWGMIGGLVAVVAFVAIALGVGLHLGRRLPAETAPVSAPDAGRAKTDTDQEADQGQVLVLELGQVKAQLVQSMSDQQRAVAAEDLLVEPLSQRELEVLELIAQGLTNREVAQKLYITTSTVKVHTRNIYGKLDVGSRTQAIAKARTLGILPNT